MPPRLSWSKLIPGLIALSILVGIGATVLAFSGVGKVRGDKARLHVLTDQARGLMAGSEVWLDGQKVGAVEHVGFRPPSADTLHRVVLSLEILTGAVDRLRADSRIRVRPGGSVIGPVVVFLESGTPAGARIRPGDTLRALAMSDAATVMEKFGAATAALPPLVADAKTVMAQARNPEGTIGAFLTAGIPTAEISALRRNVGALRARLGGDGSSAGRADLARHASAAMASADSVRTLLASPNTSFGRFRRDTSLTRVIGDITSELGDLEREMNDAQGTLTRLRTDSALMRSVAEVRSEMALLLADVKRHPLRYLHF